MKKMQQKNFFTSLDRSIPDEEDSFDENCKTLLQDIDKLLDLKFPKIKAEFNTFKSGVHTNFDVITKKVNDLEELHNLCNIIIYDGVE